MLSGIVHALRNGGRWADCPREVYGPKKTLYNRFVRWAERGIWERIFSALAGGEDAPDRLFMSTAAGICTGAAAQKCTTGSVVACPHSPWEGPARGATRPPRGWWRPARERGVWAHAGKRGVIRTVAGVVTGSA